MRVEYTEFVRPNAVQKTFHILLHDAVEEKHKAMIEAGGRLTVENLGTGQIHVCIEKPGACDYASEIVSDHIRHVASAFEKMLKAFDAADYAARGE